MEKIGLIKNTKSDINDLENYLLRNDLLDDNRIWFAGFDDRMKGDRNAIAANLFYGNSKLLVVAVKDQNIFYLRNTKEGFEVSKLAEVGEKIYIKIWRNLVFPSIEIGVKDERHIQIQANKNKKKVYDFKKLVK